MLTEKRKFLDKKTFFCLLRNKVIKGSVDENKGNN